MQEAQSISKKGLSSTSRWHVPSWELRRPVTSSITSDVLPSVRQGCVNHSESQRTAHSQGQSSLLREQDEAETWPDVFLAFVIMLAISVDPEGPR